MQPLLIQQAQSPPALVTNSIANPTRQGNNNPGVKELVDACDRALYQVKEDGRNDTQADVAAAV